MNIQRVMMVVTYSFVLLLVILVWFEYNKTFISVINFLACASSTIWWKLKSKK